MPKETNIYNSGRIINLLFLVLTALMLYTVGFSGVLSEPDPLPQEDVEPAFNAGYSDDDIFFLRDTITRYLLAQRFNGSVLAARNGTILISRSFGFADFRNHTPLTQSTPFQLASISKTFTAAAVLMLQHQGKLHIDDKVVLHIPEFPWPQITIRQLLTHTSGIQNYMWMVERYWNHPHSPNNEDMLQLFIKYPRPLNFTPGRRFGYSNTGYAFLGLLIERVTGQSYDEFMQQHIFEPLEMQHTFVYDPNGSDLTAKERALGFRRWGRRQIIIPDVHHDGVIGDKGIYSNIIDLYKWDRAIGNGHLLPDSLWQQTFEHTRLVNGRTVRYGMGWRLQSYMDNHVVHHPGRWNGFRTSFKRFIDDDATLILLSNNSRDLNMLINHLQSILFHEEIAARETPPEPEDPFDYEMIGGGN
jgi:CubicO group peptidase (beta-lactamase class C family)